MAETEAIGLDLYLHPLPIVVIKSISALWSAFLRLHLGKEMSDKDEVEVKDALPCLFLWEDFIVLHSRSCHQQGLLSVKYNQQCMHLLDMIPPARGTPYKLAYWFAIGVCSSHT